MLCFLCDDDDRMWKMAYGIPDGVKGSQYKYDVIGREEESFEEMVHGSNKKTQFDMYQDARESSSRQSATKTEIFSRKVNKRLRVDSFILPRLSHAISILKCFLEIRDD